MFHDCLSAAYAIGCFVQGLERVGTKPMDFVQKSWRGRFDHSWFCFRVPGQWDGKCTVSCDKMSWRYLFVDTQNSVARLFSRSKMKPYGWTRPLPWDKNDYLAFIGSRWSELPIQVRHIEGTWHRRQRATIKTTSQGTFVVRAAAFQAVSFVNIRRQRTFVCRFPTRSTGYIDGKWVYRKQICYLKKIMTMRLRSTCEAHCACLTGIDRR